MTGKLIMWSCVKSIKWLFIITPDPSIACCVLLPLLFHWPHWDQRYKQVPFYFTCVGHRDAGDKLRFSRWAGGDCARVISQSQFDGFDCSITWTPYSECLMLRGSHLQAAVCVCECVCVSCSIPTDTRISSCCSICSMWTSSLFCCSDPQSFAAGDKKKWAAEIAQADDGVF